MPRLTSEMLREIARRLNSTAQSVEAKAESARQAAAKGDAEAAMSELLDCNLALVAMVGYLAGKLPKNHSRET